MIKLSYSSPDRTPMGLPFIMATSPINLEEGAVEYFSPIQGLEMQGIPHKALLRTQTSKWDLWVTTQPSDLIDQLKQAGIETFGTKYKIGKLTFDGNINPFAIKSERPKPFLRFFNSRTATVITFHSGHELEVCEPYKAVSAKVLEAARKSLAPTAAPR